MRSHARIVLTRSAYLAAALSVALLAGCGSSEVAEGTAGAGGAKSAWTTIGTRATESAPSRAIISNASAAWTAYNPPATYPNVVTRRTTIPMPDGAELAATVVLPADAGGNAVETPLPTILSLTGYNKAVGDFVPTLGGGNALFVSHGYAHVIVDVRGTGASDGQWEAFGAGEQADYRPTLDWVAAQPFSNGSIGLYGTSLLGITAVLTAAQGHPAVKALFPIVPMADGYRDIVFTGGQTNIGFIPLWLGLVTALGVLDPNLVTAPATGLAQMLSRVQGTLTTFQVPLLLQSVIGDPDTAFDGEFWRVRSPIEQAGNIQVPTFIVGGLSDIFQRGEPLLYEALKNRNTTKLLMGPWTHLDLINTGLPADGVPTLDEIALRWFDQYVKGEPNGADRLPNVTQFVLGHGHFVSTTDWPHPQASAQRLYLRGDKSLSADAPAAGENSNLVLQQPLTGLCSASASQWTAGALGLIPILPCVQDDNVATLLDARYETPVLAQDLYLSGPIQADIWITTTALNAGLSVRVSDVDGAGNAAPLTNGLLTASLRAVDESRSRYLDGQMIQPWHPFTPESEQAVVSGEPMLLQVEVFPTSAMIAAGHKLRISVGPSDIPHGLPPLPDLVPGVLGVITVLSDAEHPSSVVLPVVPAGVLAR